MPPDGALFFRKTFCCDAFERIWKAWVMAKVAFLDLRRRWKEHRWTRYRRALVHATRITTASIAAYVLVYLLGLSEGLWAVITAIVVVQSSLGGSLKVGFEQLV